MLFIFIYLDLVLYLFIINEKKYNRSFYNGRFFLVLVLLSGSGGKRILFRFLDNGKR